MSSILRNRGIRVALAVLFVAGVTQLCTAQTSSLRANNGTVISVRVLGSVSLSSGAAVLSAGMPSAAGQAQVVSAPANVRWNLGQRDFQNLEVVQYVTGANGATRQLIPTDANKGTQQTTMQTTVASAGPEATAGLLNIEVRLY